MEASEVQSACARARRAQTQWALTPVRTRREIMLRLHDLILDHQVELIDLVQTETGKSRSSAFDEVIDVALTARHYAYRAGRLLRTTRVRGALPVFTHTTVQRSPRGVVGIIAPWNYPLSMALSDAIPALLAGNAVVLKPDEKTTGTALRGLELLEEAGLPGQVMQVVPGPGPTVGQEIVEQCDYLMFTGSTATGRKLAAQAGERLIGYSAELGGKNPLIVCPDADMDRAARGAVQACFSNSGQLCISIERIYVHEAVADSFLSRFLALVNDLSLGHGWTDDVGSLISAEHLARVDELVDDAILHGARVLAGARSLPDLGPTFYAPTVLIDVPPTARLHADEVFGPVVYVEKVATVDEAVAKANDSSYGLSASVWGRERTARDVASRLQAGAVNINDGFAAAWASLDAPMGGWKNSGVGRRHADEGLLKYTESRTVAAQRLMPLAGPSTMPRERYASLLSQALRVGKRFLR